MAPTASVPQVKKPPDLVAELSAFPVPPGEPRFRRVLSKRLQVSLPLPDRKGWKLQRDRSSFLVMNHAATSSSLVVRLWRESENMNRQRCEERARALRDLPTRGLLINSRSANIPVGFDTWVDVGFTTSSPGEAVGGYVLAFGAAARRCFSFSFSTVALGSEAEQIVADRLVVIDGLSFEKLQLRSAIPSFNQ